MRNREKILGRNGGYSAKSKRRSNSANLGAIETGTLPP